MTLSAELSHFSDESLESSLSWSTTSTTLPSADGDEAGLRKLGSIAGRLSHEGMFWGEKLVFTTDYSTLDQVDSNTNHIGHFLVLSL